MQINPTTVKRPLFLKDYDNQWALPINQHFSGNVIAQILLGKDCAQYLPVTITPQKGFPIQTAKARLKRSLITGKYLLFDSLEEDDQLIRSKFPCKENVNIHAVDCMTED